MEERSHHSFINGFLKTELWVDDSSPPQTAQPGGAVVGLPCLVSRRFRPVRAEWGTLENIRTMANLV